MQQKWLRVGDPRKGLIFWQAPAIDMTNEVQFWGPRSRSAQGSEARCGYEIRLRTFRAAI